MRRTLALLFPLTISLILLAVMPAMANSSRDLNTGQNFMTNTPRPDPIQFSTNTPSAPTTTPTPAVTATLTPTSTPTPTITPSPTPEPIGPVTYPDGINSLTGLPYPDEAAQNRRNLIVKISNYPPIVRPQHNVNAADVVFEAEAEGGVTRFAAIFRSNMPDRVGSVRSARLLDTELVVMFNALLAYSGTSEPIQNLILGSDWVIRAFSPLKGDNENAGFTRDEALVASEEIAFEHTMFLNTETLYELATARNVNVGYPARGFAFSEHPPDGGIPAVDVFIDWFGQTDARWQYDPFTGRYLRYTDSLAHFDAATGEQLWTDNLIVLEVEHNRRPDLFPPGANYESLEIALYEEGREILDDNGEPVFDDREPASGEGRAYVIREGQLYQGMWRRPDNEPGTAIQLYFGNNIPLTLKPGRSWVSIVRWLGDVEASETRPNMQATATVLAQTPTITPDPAANNPDS